MPDQLCLTPYQKFRSSQFGMALKEPTFKKATPFAVASTSTSFRLRCYPFIIPQVFADAYIKSPHSYSAPASQHP